MTESIQDEMDIISKSISALEESLPFIVTPTQHHIAINAINETADIIKESGLDEKFASLSTTLKILNNGDSAMLSTITYQGFILELLEFLVSIRGNLEKNEEPETADLGTLLHAGEFLIRLAGRVTNRYKLRVTFEPEYEAKGIRAFMVIKELQPISRFLSLSPDLTTNQNVNLENGLEIDLLSQESGKELHKLAGSVLEVINVQIFTETRNMPLMILDPPESHSSFDIQVKTFLES